MLFDLAVNATFILLLMPALLVVGQRLAAAEKHLLCGVSLLLIVLLPVLGQLSSGGRAVVLPLSLRPAAELLDDGEPVNGISATWVCGGVFIALRFVGGLAYLMWQTRRASAPVTGLAPARFVVRFANVTTPIMWGWYRPAILLPWAFCDWAPKLKKAAIYHELAHIKRCDSWTALVVVAAQCMYWFHPLVWWVSRKLVEQREFAADDRVLVSGMDRASYADFLVTIARSARTHTLFGCAMFSGPLRKRAERVLCPASGSPGFRSRFAVLECCCR